MPLPEFQVICTAQYLRLIQHETGPAIGTPREYSKDWCTSVLLFLDYLPEGSIRSGVYVICSCASLPKLLHRLRAWDAGDDSAL